MHGRAVTFLRFSLLLAPLTLLPAVSCKSGGGGGSGSSVVGNALLACGLITSGQLPMQPGTAEPYDNCMFQCIGGGTCAELEGLVCGLDFTLSDACTMQCIDTHGFACGDGQKLHPFWQCDGSADCADGSDELNCPPPFTCGDGTELPPQWQCDGEADCGDASDEAGCPAAATFTCTDGEQVPATWQCDFEEDCSDGSDEAGCAMIVCPDSDTTGAMSGPEPDPIETGETGGTAG